MQYVPITTTVVSSNPTQVRCARYNNEPYAGAYPGFQVRGGGGRTLKKSCQAEGDEKILGYFVYFAGCASP